MKSTKHHQIIVSIYPTSRGLGFSVFDTPKNLLDWGYCDIRFNKKARTIKKLEALIELYKPHLIVLEDADAASSRRADRIKKLITALTTTALNHNVAVQHYSNEQMSNAFGSKNKHDRARNISELIPELEPSLPPERRIWNSQHPQIQVFDAVTLALTFFYLET